MKTKQELLNKYSSDKDIYDFINANYGTEESFQTSDFGVIFFEKETMKGIVGGEKLTYEDYIDIQIQTKNNFRGSFFMCYIYGPIEFKGEVDTFRNGKICFKRIYDEYMLPDFSIHSGKEDHVWMDIKGFEKLKKGDCIAFNAEVYRYIKKKDGKKLDYGLRNPESVKKINKYDLPTDEEIIKQEIDSLICETCILSEQCVSRSNCIRNKERKLLKEQMYELIVNTKEK